MDAKCQNVAKWMPAGLPPARPTHTHAHARTHTHTHAHGAHHRHTPFKTSMLCCALNGNTMSRRPEQEPGRPTRLPHVESRQALGARELEAGPAGSAAGSAPPRALRREGKQALRRTRGHLASLAGRLRAHLREAPLSARAKVEVPPLTARGLAHLLEGLLLGDRCWRRRRRRRRRRRQ